MLNGQALYLGAGAPCEFSCFEIATSVPRLMCLPLAMADRYLNRTGCGGPTTILQLKHATKEEKRQGVAAMISRTTENIRRQVSHGHWREGSHIEHLIWYQCKPLEHTRAGRDRSEKRLGFPVSLSVISGLTRRFMTDNGKVIHELLGLELSGSSCIVLSPLFSKPMWTNLISYPNIINTMRHHFQTGASQRRFGRGRGADSGASNAPTPKF